MEYLGDAKKMKQCDQAAIEELGIPSMVLMERAALAVTEEILKGKTTTTGAGAGRMRFRRSWR